MSTFRASVLVSSAWCAIVCALASGPVACSSSGGSAGGSNAGNGGEAGSGTPTIAITSPAAGATVTPTSAMDMVNVGFTLTSFTLVAPGTPSCGNTDDTCGHIHVLVDGSQCTPDGAPYDNADATGSPAQAILSTCPAVAGAHAITLELHHNDHTPVQVNGSTVSASVMVTATAGG